MKEARFISRNKDKWKNMENGQQPDAEHLAANFIELSDDLAYARTFYPGSEVERYLNQLIPVIKPISTRGLCGKINRYGIFGNKNCLYCWPANTKPYFLPFSFSCCRLLSGYFQLLTMSRSSA